MALLDVQFVSLFIQTPEISRKAHVNLILFVEKFSFIYFFLFQILKLKNRKTAPLRTLFVQSHIKWLLLLMKQKTFVLKRKRKKESEQ